MRRKRRRTKETWQWSRSSLKGPDKRWKWSSRNLNFNPAYHKPGKRKRKNFKLNYLAKTKPSLISALLSFPKSSNSTATLKSWDWWLKRVWGLGQTRRWSIWLKLNLGKRRMSRACWWRFSGTRTQRGCTGQRTRLMTVRISSLSFMCRHLCCDRKQIRN